MVEAKPLIRPIMMETTRTVSKRLMLGGRIAHADTLAFVAGPQWLQSDTKRLLCGGATIRRITRLSRVLNRRARHVAIGTEHTTVAFERAQHGPAVSAVIEELASVGRHRLLGYAGALRAREG